MSTLTEPTDIDSKMTDTTMEGPAIASTTTSDNLLTTTDTPMEDPSTANDVYRSSSATVHIVSDNGGMTQVSTGIQQTNGQTGSDKSTTPTYTTEAAQPDKISTMASQSTSGLLTGARNGEQSKQNNPRAPGTSSGSPTLIDQIEQTDFKKGCNSQSTVGIMIDTSMDWDADLDTKCDGENVDFGDVLMEDLGSAMAATDASDGSSTDVQTNGDAAGNMQNVLAGIDDIEAGLTSYDLLFSKLSKAAVDRKKEPAELPRVQQIPASIFGKGLGSWNFDEIPAEPRDSQMEIDGQSTYVAEQVQDPKLRSEIPDSQLEAPIQIPTTQQHSTMTTPRLPGRVLHTEVPDSQMEDIDSIIASPPPPAEDNETYDSDASDDVRPSNYRAATVESESSDYDDLAMAEELQKAEKRREYELRESTRTGRHPTASSWIDHDPSENYDPEVEAKTLRKLNRPKKRKGVAKSTQDESKDEKGPDEAPGSMVMERGFALADAEQSAEKEDAAQNAADTDTTMGAGTRHEDVPSGHANEEIPAGLGESIFGNQPRQSEPSQAMVMHPCHAPVIQKLRRHDGEICCLCFPKFRLFGDRGGYKATITPICHKCRGSRFAIMLCTHDKIRRVPGIDDTKPSVRSAKARAMLGVEREGEIWCSLCCDIAEHRCKTVGETGTCCGLALCIACSSALRKDVDGNLQELLGAMRQGEAGTRRNGWRADALLLETSVYGKSTGGRSGDGE
ncbi:hypothetical protein LTR95_010092 [Oleoguttula sp. CCFEE 5521]